MKLPPASRKAAIAPARVQLGIEGLEESAQLFDGAHVGLEGERLTARRRDRADGGARRLGITPVIDTDQCPVPCQSQGDGPADTPRPARHDGDLPLEAHDRSP
jgi:hypothetical protein